MAKYFGSECITDCSGHKAGAKYVRSGGRKMNVKSPSFVKGMRKQQSRMKRRGQTIRLRK